MFAKPWKMGLILCTTGTSPSLEAIEKLIPILAETSINQKVWGL